MTFLNLVCSIIFLVIPSSLFFIFLLSFYLIFLEENLLKEVLFKHVLGILLFVVLGHGCLELALSTKASFSFPNLE